MTKSVELIRNHYVKWFADPKDRINKPGFAKKERRRKMKVKDHPDIRRMIIIVSLIFLLFSTAVVVGTYNSYIELQNQSASYVEEKEEDTMVVSLFKRIPIGEIEY